MRVLRTLQNVEAIPHRRIRLLVQQRLTELGLEEPYNQFGEFILVEPGDTPASLEAETGCWITSNPFSEDRYGDPDFMPCFEWLEYHAQAHCYEMLFIMTDDGIGTALFVPDEPDIDPDLLAFCRTYATPVEAD